jgi:phage terminase large subunit-like protein
VLHAERAEHAEKQARSNDVRIDGFAAFCSRIGLELEPFQRRIAKAADGPERECVVLLPRGQGKTTLLAAIALHHLITVEGAAVYCAASSREQARILFEAASAFARVLDHPNIVDRHLELRYCPDPSVPRVFSRHLRVLAADAPRLHGLTPSLAIVDELHAHASDEVYLALGTAMLKRPGAKLIVISTAGQGVDSPLGRLRARALAQPKVSRRGAVTDARGKDLRFLEWGVPEDGDVDDPKAVKKANPASWITAAGLAAQREAVPDLAYRRFHANQWTEREGHWLPPGAWQACEGKPAFIPGEDVWIGVDVGGERSASAVVWVNEQLQVGCAIYHGDQGVLDCADHVRELAATYSVRELVFDPWRFGQSAQELERERIPAMAFPQTDVRMIPASDRLYRAIVEKRLTLPDDDELRQHAAAAIAKHSRRGWRIDKADRADNIDAIIALCMALERAEQKPEEVRLLGWL